MKAHLVLVALVVLVAAAAAQTSIGNCNPFDALPQNVIDDLAKSPPSCHPSPLPKSARIFSLLFFIVFSMPW